MKNQLFLIMVFCFFSNIICSMEINLDETSKANLIAQVTKENLSREYWPADVEVELERFDLIKDACEYTANPKYHVRVVGRVKRIHVENDRPVLLIIRRDTSGWYFKNELNSFGVNLPQELAQSSTKDSI
jgi:hypothetical protein